MNKKIVTMIILVILIVISMCNTCSAKSTTITASNSTVDSEKEITVSISSATSLSGYTISIQSLDGCSFKSASVPNDVNGSVNGSTIAGTSGSGTKKLAIYKFTAPSATTDKTCKIKFTISGMLSADDEELDDATATATITVKAPATPKLDPEPEPEPETETKPTVLEFKSVNETVYATGTVNVRKSYSASSESLGQLKEGDSATRTGVSKTSSEGYYWSKINFNGTTAYVISSKLTTTKPEEKPVETPSEEKPVENTEEPAEISNEPQENDTEIIGGLKSLEIEGITLSPKFEPNVYEYRVIVKEDLSELPINAVATEEGATITIAGNKNLKEGENLITIVVYNEKNGETATYQITMNKNTVDLSKIDKWLQEGTLSAKRERTIYITIFSISLVGLVVVMILKTIIRNKEDEYVDEEMQENELNVENIAEQMLQEEIAQEETEQEIRRPRREKRKGKHF